MVNRDPGHNPHKYLLLATPGHPGPQREGSLTFKAHFCPVSRW